MKKEMTPLEKATAAYSRQCARRGTLFNQPDVHLSEVGRIFVHLRNINGELAKIRIKPARSRGNVRRVKSTLP